MQKVQAFIVGQPKSGTTALAHFLDQHPGVFVSQPKEPHYFCTDFVRESDEFHGGDAGFFPFRSEEQYATCFADASADQLLVDASTQYLVSSEAAGNIHAYNPDAKIILMLREPVSFLQSLHQQYVNSAWETEPDFPKALQLEASRREANQIPKNTCTPSFLYYSNRVRYAEQIKRYTDLFGDNVVIVIHEEFSRDNESHFAALTKFIGADSTFVPEFSRVHERRAPRNMFIHRILNAGALKNNVRSLLSPRTYDRLKHAVANIFLESEKKPVMAPELEDKLRGEFGPEVLATAEHIGRSDLPRLWGYG